MYSWPAVQQKSSKIKVIKCTCTESGNVNVSSDVNPITNVGEMDSDDQEDDNLSCLENEIFNENNSFNIDSVLELDNDKNKTGEEWFLLPSWLYLKIGIKKK